MNKVFGNSLRRLRKQKGKSQKFLALEAGLDQSYLAGVERGRRPPPKDHVLARLATALRATPQERSELTRSIAIARIGRSMELLDEGFSELLVQLATSMRHCSHEEIHALKTIARALEQRSTTAGEKGGVM